MGRAHFPAVLRPGQSSFGGTIWGTFKGSYSTQIRFGPFCETATNEELWEKVGIWV
ncbi:hypothetical protein GCM10011517_22250 [Actibacterium pelagium]|uniref:Uncharacterized protein n=1 Tax=Actibacterium pelagium TaxID=2029103 RepID=A0A917AIA8_9RHOB|nr:hypothetical protein GCM10011517_22250 [Actibacterium pelagium]